MNILTWAPHKSERNRSFFVKARNAFEQGFTFGLYDPEGSHRSEVDQRDLVNDQIKSFKETTELAKKETDRVRAEKDAEKRRIQEKQIRSLRGKYRSGGFLGNGASEPNAGISDKLGG